MLSFELRQQTAAQLRAMPSSMPAESTLELKGVRKKFRSGKRDIEILKAVDLTIGKGEVVAMVGASGAGKTTLFHIVAGLLSADSGTASFQQMSMPLSETHRDRQAMSLVFQDPYAALSPHLRVEETVLEPLKIKGHKGNLVERVCQALAAVRLAPSEAYLNRYPGQLSGGQRQRVAIARAIVTNPVLLLADEPTSMLDASAGIGILNLFRRFAAGGMAVLITIHDLASACYVADRLAILHEGRIVEQGEPLTILANPQHKFTRTLIAAARDDGALRQ
ncbi:MAG: dipeptide/oligopeptide/nickel ABC transporter ATP-binding protein [Desulforhabdus sp.]|jgi:ABC-type glutathione transport system ATPase component|nr:dipeptide/oligopeptide/nickel ABC transporter ATP-binding protein [Desulforhabdus sp.]